MSAHGSAATRQSTRSVALPRREIEKRYDDAKADLDRALQAGDFEGSGDDVMRQAEEIRQFYDRFRKVHVQLTDKLSKEGAADEVASLVKARREVRELMREGLHDANSRLRSLGLSLVSDPSLAGSSIAATSRASVASEARRQVAEERRREEDEAAREAALLQANAERDRLKALEVEKQRVEEDQREAEQQAKWKAEQDEWQAKWQAEQDKLRREEEVRAAIAKAKREAAARAKDISRQAEDLQRSLAKNALDEQVREGRRQRRAATASGASQSDVGNGLLHTIDEEQSEVRTRNFVASHGAGAATSTPLPDQAGLVGLFGPGAASQPVTCTGTVPKKPLPPVFSGNAASTPSTGGVGLQAGAAGLAGTTPTAGGSGLPAGRPSLVTGSRGVAQEQPTVAAGARLGWAESHLPGTVPQPSVGALPPLARAPPFVPSSARLHDSLLTSQPITSVLQPAPAWARPNAHPVMPGAQNVQQPQNSDLADRSAANFLSKRDLERVPARPFTGESDQELFFVWKAALQNRMNAQSLNPLEKMDVLVAHTAGKARKVVNMYHAAAAFNPDSALAKVWEELHERFGSGQKVSANLMKRVASVPKMKDDAKLGERLQELRGHCRMLALHLPHVPALQALNLSIGQEPIWRKLPDRFIKRWCKIGAEFEKANAGQHPPFHRLLEYLETLVVECSSDNFQAYPVEVARAPSSKAATHALATLVEGTPARSFGKESHPPARTTNREATSSALATSSSACHWMIADARRGRRGGASYALARTLRGSARCRRVASTVGKLTTTTCFVARRVSRKDPAASQPSHGCIMPKTSPTISIANPPKAPRAQHVLLASRRTRSARRSVAPKASDRAAQRLFLSRSRHRANPRSRTAVMRFSTTNRVVPLLIRTCSVIWGWSCPWSTAASARWVARNTTSRCSWHATWLSGA